MFVLTKKNLEEYLLKFDIPISTWGKGSAKTITHLLNEVIKGESVLFQEDGKLIREVSALSIIVTYKDLILREDYQEFTDGRKRKRKMEASVAEKLDKNDTDLTSAVKRGIQEELEISIESPQIKDMGNISKFRESMSYPGVMSKITLYKFHVDLNESQFKSEGYVEIQEDKKTFFVWLKK